MNVYGMHVDALWLVHMYVRIRLCVCVLLYV